MWVMLLHEYGPNMSMWFTDNDELTDWLAENPYWSLGYVIEET